MIVKLQTTQHVFLYMILKLEKKVAVTMLLVHLMLKLINYYYYYPQI